MLILCLAEDSREISSLIFSEKRTVKKYLLMPSAAVVIGALSQQIPSRLLIVMYKKELDNHSKS